MELFIIFGIIIIIIVITTSSRDSCKHDWVWTKSYSQTTGTHREFITDHQCTKCNKVEECTFYNDVCKCGSKSDWVHEIFGYDPRY